MDTNAHNIGLRRVTLEQLNPDINNALIIAIIIAKQRPRRFADAKSSEGRAVWNFTIRDSPRDYINATFWGNGDLIVKLYDDFQVGDIVEIHKPNIAIRNIDAYGEQFRPMVTSPFHLILNDNQSSIIMFDKIPGSNYKSLLPLATKPLAGFVTLADIKNSGAERVGFFVDILVAVKAIGTVRNIKAKDGTEYQVRDFLALDNTCPEGVRIPIWDPDLITRAGFWTPKTTILFMTDMKIDLNKFHRIFLPNISSKTIITENPVGREADNLRNYALTAPIQPTEILESLSYTIENINAIQNVMSIRQVVEKMETLSNPAAEIRTTDRHFTALLYVLVTQLDLDGLSKIVSVKCANCKSLLRSGERHCENLDCNLGGNLTELDCKFDLRVHLSDHTGSLLNCRLTGQIAENILGCNVEEFSRLTDDGKCNLKWKFLMERCAVRIMVLCVPGTNPLCSILSCVVASPDEVASKLRHF